MENGTFETNNADVVISSNQENESAEVVQMDYNTDFPTLPTAAPQRTQLVKNPHVWARSNLAKKDVTVSFHLASDERSKNKASFGTATEEHKKAQAIAAATKTRIELCESKDGELTVIIRGERAKVEDARARIVRELQTQASREIDIPKEHHRRLIGKEGALLHSLEQDTNCRIQIPGRDDPSSIITITGPREGIEKAVAHISAVSERESKLGTEHIPCPKHLIPYVRGPFNETYDRLTSETGVKINIPPPSVENDIIVVSGEKDGVMKAASEIRQIVEAKKNVTNITIPVARSQHRYIIGPQGSVINQILKDTGVIVIVPSGDSNDDNVKLIGDAANLSTALEMVIARASSVITQSIDAPSWLHKHIRGARNVRLNELIPDLSKLHIDFDENNTIFFEGSPEEVKSAQAIIAKEVAKLQGEMKIEKIKVHPSIHKHIIGRGGSLISKIKESTGVQVTIPNETTNSDEIIVEGKKDGVTQAVSEIKAIATKIENEKSKDIIIPQRLHKFVIGNKTNGVQSIRDSHPNVSIIFPDISTKSDVVNIRGDKNEVDVVYKILSKISKELAENNHQQSVTVYKEFLKHIIGKGGATIRKIREETGTRIDQPDIGSNDDKIIVTGKQENVAKAVAQLQKIQEELSNISEESLEISLNVQSRLLGNGRRLINDIEEECGGVHIKFPPVKTQSTKVTVRGPADDVKKAVAVLSALVKDKEMVLVEDTVKSKKEFHRFLIGKGGSKVGKLRDSFNVRIMFPKEEDEDKETIHLMGEKDDVAKVKNQLEKEIAELLEKVEIKFDVDSKYHKNFLIRGASLLKEIQDQNGGVQISIPKTGNEFTIRGPKQCAESAKARIEEIIEDYERHTTSTVEIPAQHHRRLLNNRAQKIRELSDRLNVQIRFPSRDSEENPDTVSISGRDTNVEQAKECLLALVPISKVIQVPVEMHGNIIGRGGENVRKLMQDYDVNISIPKGGDSEDITVTGQSENVEQALEALREKLTEYEQQAEDRKLRQWSITIDVPLDYHTKIIGPRGATIKKLNKQFNVNINVPREEEASEQVKIQGYESDARACAAHIEEMVAELRAMFTQEISLDSRYHRRLIGSAGKNLKKVMEQFQVEIRFPRQGAEDPNLVVVAGKDEDVVYDCIDYLREEEEEFLLDCVDRFQPPKQTAPSQAQKNPAAVEIKGAPWQLDLESSEQFPNMGSSETGGGNATPVGGAWGYARRW